MLSGAQTVNPRGPFTPAGESYFDHLLEALDGNAAAAAGDSYGVSRQSPLWNMPRTFRAGGSSGSESYFAELSGQLRRLEADLLRRINEVDLDDPDFVATLLSYNYVAENETLDIFWVFHRYYLNNKMTQAQLDSFQSLRGDVKGRVNRAVDARIMEGLNRSSDSSGLRDDTESWLAKVRDVIGKTLSVASFDEMDPIGNDVRRNFRVQLEFFYRGLSSKLNFNYSLRALSERGQSGLAASFYVSHKRSEHSTRDELNVLLHVTAVQEAFTPERLNVINAIKGLITLSNYRGWVLWNYGTSDGLRFLEFIAWGMTYLAQTRPDAATDLKVGRIFEDLLSQMRIARSDAEAKAEAKAGRRSFWDRLLGREDNHDDRFYSSLSGFYSEEFGTVMDATTSARSAGIEEIRRAITAASGSSTPPAPATPAPSGSGTPSFGSAMTALPIAVALTLLGANEASAITAANVDAITAANSGNIVNIEEEVLGAEDGSAEFEPMVDPYEAVWGAMPSSGAVEMTPVVW